MTTARDPEDARRIVELLAESGQETSAELEETLYGLLALASKPAPVPSGELATLVQIDDITQHRWARRHRTGLIIFGVVGALSLGATGAAASSLQFRELAQDTVVNLVNNYTPFHIDRPKRPTNGEDPGSGTPSIRPPSPTSPGESGQSTSGDSSDGNSGSDQPSVRPGGGSSSDRRQPSDDGQRSSGDSTGGSPPQDQPVPAPSEGAD